MLTPYLWKADVLPSWHSLKGQFGHCGDCLETYMIAVGVPVVDVQWDMYPMCAVPLSLGLSDQYLWY